MTEEPRIYNQERTVPSINGVGKTGQPHAENETGLLPYTLHNMQQYGWSLRALC